MSRVTPALLLMIMFDFNVSSEAVLPDQEALPWLLSALRMISNQQNVMKIS